jgi:hypothetical protein
LRSFSLPTLRVPVAIRLAEQAKLSGEPLSDEQTFVARPPSLLSSAPANWHPEIPVLVPRNINVERVCALGDRQVNPASLDWEFAFAVFTLDRHPMGVFCNGQA